MTFIKKIYWWLKALLAKVFFGRANQNIVLIGVTGTDGKTTTVSLIYHLLKTAQKKVSFISSVEANIAGTRYDTGFHVTTPSPFFIQKKIKEAVKNKDQFFVLESTSHALDQLRLWGCHFKIAALTNITNEHLDYHKNYLRYAKTKCSFLNKAEIAVVNIEAQTFYKYKDFINNKNLWTSAVNRKANFVYSDLKKNGLRQKFTDFEKENIVLAAAVCQLLGLEIREVVKGLNSFKRVKGRFNYLQKGPYHYLIDFAHTPAAFNSLFAAIKKTIKYQRLIHVFGAAGLRDFYKREVMGEVSARYSDIIIITEEDYRTEDPKEIFRAIEKGIKKNPKFIFEENYFYVPNRQEAVNLAIKMAEKNDLMVFTGKAHEQSLCRGKTEYPWDEFKAVERGIEERNKK